MRKLAMILCAIGTMMVGFTTSALAYSYTERQIADMFRNSGNPYLAANADVFAAMSYRVESGGSTTIYNGSCCTGLMQMNNTNIATFAGMTRQQYALLTGPQQIEIYRRYFESIQNATAIQTLLGMQQRGESLGGQPVDAAMIAACIQLGVGNCQKSINNNCASTERGQGGDGHVNICTMAAKTGGGDDPTSSGGGGSCFASLPVANPEIYSDYGAWNRPGVSGGNNGWHRGLDIRKVGQSQASQKGEPIIAVTNGDTRWGGEGNMHLLHTNGAQTRYMHLSKREEARKGVKGGEKIAEMGHTGAGGPGGTHLHFELLVPGSQLSGNGGVVLPLGSGKRNKSAALTASQIAKALPKTLYYVNPETYLPERIPVVGNAAARTGRTTSLPNTCSPDQASLEEPRSSSEQLSPAQSLREAAEFRGAEIGTGQEQAFLDQKSLWVDYARMTALDVQAQQIDFSTAMDSALAHVLAAYIVRQRSRGDDETVQVRERRR